MSNSKVKSTVYAVNINEATKQSGKKRKIQYDKYVIPCYPYLYLYFFALFPLSIHVFK